MTAESQAGGWPGGPSRRPAAPRQLGPAGRTTWRKLAARYEFSPDELVLLAELCRTVDLLARLRAAQADAPLMVPSKVHGQVASPLLAGIRDAQAELRRLHQALAFPVSAAGLPVVRWPGSGARDRRSHRRAG